MSILPGAPMVTRQFCAWIMLGYVSWATIVSPNCHNKYQRLFQRLIYSKSEEALTGKLNLIQPIQFPRPKLARF